MGLNFCPSCGSKLVADVKFCPACGYEITEIDKSKAIETKPQIPVEKAKKEKNEVPKVGPGVYADFWERLFAFLIDVIIIAIIGYIIKLPLGLNSFVIGGNLLLIIASNVVDWILGFLYFFLLEAYNEGQTLGKMALSLRTVDDDKLDFAKPGQHVINNLAKANILLFLIDSVIGFLVYRGDEKKRLRLFQDWSDTVVIKTQ